jgi:hypothetical protein
MFAHLLNIVERLIRLNLNLPVGILHCVGLIVAYDLCGQDWASIEDRLVG